MALSEQLPAARLDPYFPALDRRLPSAGRRAIAVIMLARDMLASGKAHYSANDALDEASVFYDRAARICAEANHPDENTCPKCGQDVPVGERCGHCGAWP